MSTSSASLGVLAAVFAPMLMACNNLLGLDSAVSDEDRDGVASALDNCPLDENPQQRDRDNNGLGDVCDCTTSGIDADQDDVDDACDDCIGEAVGVDSGNDGIDDGCQPCSAATGMDADGDGIDDACDACTLGTPHDEDGDGIADACDNCPTQPNPEQAATACDRGVSGARRFDPLVEQDPTLWPGVVSGWTWTDDALLASGMTARSTLTELMSAYLVETRASTTARLSLQCASITSLVSCTFHEATRTLVVVDQFGLNGGLPPPPVSASSTPLPPTGAVRFQLRVDPDPVTPSTSCEALDATGAVIASATIDEYLTCRRFKVESMGESRLDYLWIVGE